MRRFTVGLLTILVLSLGTSLAQTIEADPSPIPPGDYWGGLSVGGGGASGLSFHFGILNALGEGISLRPNLQVGALGTFGLGADAMFNLPVAVDGPLAVYAGGGPAVALGGVTALGLNLFVGAEYRLVDLDFPAGGVFIELGPNLNFTPIFTGGFYGRGGVNFHF